MLGFEPLILDRQYIHTRHKFALNIVIVFQVSAVTFVHLDYPRHQIFYLCGQ